MTLPDYPDWQTPVALSEQVNQLTAPGQTISGASGNLDLDTSGDASVAITLGPPGGAAGDQYALIIQWLFGATLLDTTQLTTYATNSYTGNPAPFTLQLPVRGPTLRLAMVASAAGVSTISVFGSTRNVAGGLVSQGSNASRLLFADLGSVLAAGATSPITYVPPGSGLVRMTTPSVTSKMVWNVRALTRGPAGITQLEIGTFASDNVRPLDVEFHCPTMAMLYTIKNNDAVAHTTETYLWDVT